MWRHERRLRIRVVRGQKASCVVEVQMREYDHIDISRSETSLVEILNEDVFRLLHPKPIPKLGLKEGADPRFEKHPPRASSGCFFDEHRAARQRDTVELVRRDPA